ncbi:MAG TPA: flagellar basal body P-ring formation chaperone FlgA [Bryobacteraceae bacterium]|nr:flagellar basal body P-ring formation chaperone FlgA [Bryobacteraceae bacterium]
MMAFGALLFANCLALGAASDRVTAADLAPAFPGLESIPPDTPLGLAPAPGVARVFRVPELKRIAGNFHLAAPAGEICIQRTMTKLDPARLLAAMEKTLPGARIEILDFSRRPIPEGDLEFPLSGLREGAAGAFWNGNVHYGGNRLFSIWAKVSVWVKVQRVVAATDLQPGNRIGADQIRIETREEFPEPEAFPDSINQVAGQLARMPIRAGTAIRTAQLEAPKQVLSGETVTVDVWSGGAHLKLEARAEGSGVHGQTIPVLNPATQKRFWARIEGKGRVSVDGSTAGSHLN